MRKKNKRVITLIVIELILIVCIVGIFTWSRLKQRDSGFSTIDSSTENNEIISEETEVPVATLLFASDYQNEPGWEEPKTTLSAIVDTAKEDGKIIDNVIMCGDYSNEYKKYDYQISPEVSIKEIQTLFKEKIPNIYTEEMVFIQGNHDAFTESITESGLHEYDNYLVYVLNTQDDFPWCQGKTSGSLKKVTSAATEMETCFDRLIASGETRPVIIAGHVPLHFTARTSSKHNSGDNLYSSLIFDVVNNAAKSLDIIYLFGHNHSKGWDCYLGGACVYRASGDNILIPTFNNNDINTDEYTVKQLNFTYMNAGYVGYYMNCGPDELNAGILHEYDAADMTLTCTICEIYPDAIIITRYDNNGQHNLGSQGCANPYKNFIDRGLITENYYSNPIPSSQTIKRITNRVTN